MDRALQLLSISLLMCTADLQPPYRALQCLHSAGLCPESAILFQHRAIHRGIVPWPQCKICILVPTDHVPFIILMYSIFYTISLLNHHLNKSKKSLNIQKTSGEGVCYYSKGYINQDIFSRGITRCKWRGGGRGKRHQPAKGDRQRLMG